MAPSPTSESEPLAAPAGADATRRALVQAARRRFARDGYRATPVRAIAADAGVNVALINRYFGSKEGLFEACMRTSVDGLGLVDGRTGVGLAGVVEEIVSRVATSSTGDGALQLLLLLRSSGDEGADAIRRRTLASFARQLAVNARGEVDEALLLRAEVALATTFGLVVLRESAGIEPLASAGMAELAGPIADVFDALLGDRARPSAAR